MIFKKMNTGNRSTYDVLIIDSISDNVYGNIALLKNNAEYDPEPYVVALGYDITDGIWRSGWYYETEEIAKKIFYTHTAGGYKNE